MCRTRLRDALVKWRREHQELPLILGVARKDDANYLDACRTKRRWWDASSLLGRDVYFKARTVERTEPCLLSVMTMNRIRRRGSARIGRCDQRKNV